MLFDPTAIRETSYLETGSWLPPPVDARDNIKACLARDLPEFQPALLPHDGTAVICGSGPSIEDFIEDIRAEKEKRRPIVAVKGAHDLLCKNGIIPDLFVSVEAKPKLENVQLKNDHTLYMLSSRCSPELHEHLEGCKVMVFHTYDDKSGKSAEMEGKTLIGGGTTSGLRAVTLLYLLGFAKQVLYGFDSCVADDMRKRYDSGPMPMNLLVDRIVGGRSFLCNGAMAMQADEFQEYFTMLPELLISAKGDGLLAAIMAERKKRGYSGVLNP